MEVLRVPENTTNPMGIVELLNSLPSESYDTDYIIEFPDSFVHSFAFPILAAWSKLSPVDTTIRVSLDGVKESANRLYKNIGLLDILHDNQEYPRVMFKSRDHIALQPIVPGTSTDETLDRVYTMIDDWANYQKDVTAFRTILSELAENVLVHSESAQPGYLFASAYSTGAGRFCEITYADTGIGIKSSYLEGNNEQAKNRILSGTSALRIAVDGLNSSKRGEISPGGRSYFGWGLNTVKRLLELNRGTMSVFSGDEFFCLNQYGAQTCQRLENSWKGTIVALVIDLTKELPLEQVYDDEETELIPDHIYRNGSTISFTKTTSLDDKDINELSSEDPNLPEKRSVLLLREYGTSLLSRETGLAIRAELALLLVDGATVEVDLDEIEDITPSVADECFGKLAVRLGEEKYNRRIVLRGGSPVLRRLLDLVVNTRIIDSAKEQTIEQLK